MENLRYDLEPLAKKSKYVGNVYQGWTVIKATKTDDGHTRFFLRREFWNDRRHFDMTFTVRDNQMTALSRGKDINILIANKTVLCHKYKNNIFQNTIMSQFLPR